MCGVCVRVHVFVCFFTVRISCLLCWLVICDVTFQNAWASKQSIRSYILLWWGGSLVFRPVDLCMKRVGLLPWLDRLNLIFNLSVTLTFSVSVVVDGVEWRSWWKGWCKAFWLPSRYFAWCYGCSQEASEHDQQHGYCCWRHLCCP